MKNRVLGLVGITLVALLCFALPAFGQDNIYFNGSYSGDVYSGGPDGSVGTGFYGGSINGTNTVFVCDDYGHDISAGETWKANGVNAASLTSTTGLQFASIGLGGYTELAYLVNQMFTTSPNSANQSAISQAIWYITGGVKWAQISSSAQSFYTAAAAFLSGGGTLSEFANLWIYTPIPGTQSGDLGTAQEVWGVPEGGAALLYLLLAGASCFGAMFLRSRNQSSRPGMA
jgi:hypothetical protein